MKIKSLALAGFIALGMSISAASAAVVDVVSIDQAARNSLDPTKSLDLGGGSWNPGRTPVVGSVGGQWRSPWEGDTAGNEDTPYWTVGPSPSGSPNLPNPASLEFSTDQTQLSFLWGSVDTLQRNSFLR